MRIPQETYDSFKETIKTETFSGAVVRLIKEEIDYMKRKEENEDTRVIRIIDGRKYDTGTARIISKRRYNSGLHTVLYKKKTGELFIHCYSCSGSIHLPDIINKSHHEWDDYLSELHIDEDAAEAFEE